MAGGAVLGYLEADFLGFTNDNLNVTSNSNTLRLRLYFVDYRRGKWEILGGQNWSMVTPSRTGMASCLRTSSSRKTWTRTIMWA